MVLNLFTQSGYEFGFQRQLGGGKFERPFGDIGRHPVNFKHDPARLDPTDPKFN
jgi:hypothetical protein